jgi:predicted kinase
MAGTMALDSTQALGNNFPMAIGSRELPAPVLVIITGPPASGKTTIARQVSAATGLPLISKDDLKMIFYEIFGWGGREPDQKASAAAYEVIYHMCRAELSCGRSVIVEANFREEATTRFLELKDRNDFHPFQVRCTAEEKILLDRLRKRAAGGVRHPGHADDLIFEQLDYLIASGPQLPLGGSFLEIDTSNQDRAGALVEEACRRLRDLLDPSADP